MLVYERWSTRCGKEGTGQFRSVLQCSLPNATMKRICQSCGQRYGECCPQCREEWARAEPPPNQWPPFVIVRPSLELLSGYTFFCKNGHSWQDGEGDELRGSCFACLHRQAATLNSFGFKFVMPPGVYGGACLICHHPECVKGIELAAQLCAYCERSIGYEVLFSLLPDGRVAHKACEDEGLIVEPKEGT